MIERQLPKFIATSVSLHINSTIHLHQDEIDAVQHVSSKRATEFLDGRNCAHHALKKLGFNYNHSILSGNHREPLWPATIVGSITHCELYCAAAVAYATDISGIGIDAEQNKQLSKSLIQTILTQNELLRYTVLDITEFCIFKLIFSAKESFFKLLYPKIKRYIGFQDVEIDLDIKARSFTATLLDIKLSEKINLSSSIGKFQFNQSHLITSIYCKP